MKNPTQWLPQSGLGYLVNQPGIFLQDNLGNTIVDNSGNTFVPNPFYVIGKYATMWSQV